MSSSDDVHFNVIFWWQIYRSFLRSQQMKHWKKLFEELTRESLRIFFYIHNLLISERKWNTHLPLFPCQFRTKNWLWNWGFENVIICSELVLKFRLNVVRAAGLTGSTRPCRICSAFRPNLWICACPRVGKFPSLLSFRIWTRDCVSTYPYFAGGIIENVFCIPWALFSGGRRIDTRLSRIKFGSLGEGAETRGKKRTQTEKVRTHEKS